MFIVRPYKICLGTVYSFKIYSEFVLPSLRDDPQLLSRKVEWVTNHLPLVPKVKRIWFQTVLPYLYLDLYCKKGYPVLSKEILHTLRFG